MWQNYLKLALRHIESNRLFALLNVLGLAIGLSVFMFSVILVDYEATHDTMFSKHPQIYSVGSLFSKASKEPISEYPNVRLAYAPLFEKAIPEALKVVRSIHRERVVTINSSHAYMGIRFVDNGFTDIFDFHYLKGTTNALQNTDGLILTRSEALARFGHLDVLGDKVLVNHQVELTVTAVIEDVPPNSHFNSSLMPHTGMTSIASIQALVALGDIPFEGEWDSLNPADMTYFLLPENLGREWLQEKVDKVYQRFTSESEKNYIGGLKVRPIIEANPQVWDALGFPVLKTVQLLGLLVLLVSCLNFINMTTAQNLNRTREVGLRKCFGASRQQLLQQYLLESMVIAFLATLIALSFVEMSLPIFNQLTGKSLQLDYLLTIPRVLTLGAVVGLLAGGYPSYVITQCSPIQGIANEPLQGLKGQRFRSFMICIQFTIAIFILALSAIIYFQNAKIQQLVASFPTEDVVVLERVNIPSVQPKSDRLKQALTHINGVEMLSFSDGTPFNELGSTIQVPNSDSQDKTRSFRTVSIDTSFLSLYNIALLAGRNLSPDTVEDIKSSNSTEVNVIVNELVIEQLGISEPIKALGQTFTGIADEKNPKEMTYNIVGVMPNQYFLGAHFRLPPIIFLIEPAVHSYISLKLSDTENKVLLNDIQQAWDVIVDDYPMRLRPLEYYFNLFYRIPKGIVGVLASFTLLATFLALIGLFGLAAFMAKQRTREIGIRKVMGAEKYRIVGILSLQFSQPVFWSILLATPLAYLASDIYLSFYQEPIDYVLPLILLSNLVAIIIAVSVVLIHAVKVANLPPADSLRYE